MAQLAEKFLESSAPIAAASLGSNSRMKASLDRDQFRRNGMMHLPKQTLFQVTFAMKIEIKITTNLEEVIVFCVKDGLKLNANNAVCFYALMHQQVVITAGNNFILKKISRDARTIRPFNFLRKAIFYCL
jgi:hypothetical protein